MSDYWRPIPCNDAALGGHALAGGPMRFTHVEHLHRDGPARLLRAEDAPGAVLARLTAPRAPICGLALDRPRIMGVLNVTPDSFSDGGQFHDPEKAVAAARAMARQGDIIDIGGESTRPGAEPVAEAEELARTVPVITALRAAGIATPISIDTRKAGVARQAIAAGAGLFNDVTALSHDPESLAVAAGSTAAVCLMHAAGDPRTMQDDPRYDDVLLDVYDYLETRVAMAEAAGIARARILVDPGIGFGKTLDHNLALVRGLSLFHGLGCAVLLGVSRKRFIGTISDTAKARDRMPGSLAVALEGLRQGVQVLRVHDVAETRQALALWHAMAISQH